MVRALREVSDELLWFEARKCWRFAYRDPFSAERKFLNCVPERFAVAEIELPSPDAVRRRTKVAEDFCRKLRRVFFDSLRYARPETVEGPPTLTAVIDSYFNIYDQQTIPYRENLRRILGEFVTAATDKPVDEVVDLDLKTFERRLTARGLANATVRSYLAQVGMLLNYALKKGWLKVDPRATYRKPRERLRDPNPLTDDELTKFVSVRRTAPISAARHRAPWMRATRSVHGTRSGTRRAPSPPRGGGVAAVDGGAVP